MGALRGGTILTGFFALTVPLMPVQAAFLRFNPTFQIIGNYTTDPKTYYTN